MLQVAQQATNDATAAVRAALTEMPDEPLLDFAGSAGAQASAGSSPLDHVDPPTERRPRARRRLRRRRRGGPLQRRRRANERAFDQAVALRWMRGNASAVDFLRSAFDVAHFWDDLADKDQILDDGQVDAAMFQALVLLPRNAPTGCTSTS